MARKPPVKVLSPAAARRKTITLDRKMFLTALGKSVLMAIPVVVGAMAGKPSAGDLAKLGTHIVELVASLGLKKTPEKLASTLVFTAASKAAFELVQEAVRGDSEDKSPHASIAELHALLEQPDPEDLVVMLEHVLTAEQLFIDLDFFKHPTKDLPVETIASVLAQWLSKLGLPLPQTQAIANRFERYFVYALYDEWHSLSQSYAPLLTAVESPFDVALERTMAWERYWAHLRRQVQLPMMAESFGLDAVYIPLRAYFVTEDCPDDGCREAKDIFRHGMEGRKTSITQHVVELNRAVRDWLSKDDKDDAIRLICGGPGSGKSSFAKMLAAELSGEGHYVVFIPLSRQHPDKPLKEIVGDFLYESRSLPFNPLDEQDNCLLLILDGLDELSMQGRSGVEAAKRLIDDVVRASHVANIDMLRLRCIVTGRDLSMQIVEQAFRLSRYSLHILPYCIDKRNEMSNPEDPEELLDVDQRDDWWRKYGQASGQIFKDMPQVLRQDRLREMTGQPLLNYLLAVIYTHEPHDFANARLSTIYKRLLIGVYKRDYSKPHPALDDLSQEKFFFALENIAVAIWHGDGRSANLAELKAHCNTPSLPRLLEQVLGGLDQGLMRLLTAFYFRQARQRGESETFEFTHKSFGEYLIARSIVTTLGRLSRKFIDSDKDLYSTWTFETALQDWLAMCGPRPIDEYIYMFINDIVADLQIEIVLQWQKLCVHLINIVVDRGAPMAVRPEGVSFKTQCQQARNAEMALLLMHCACAKRTTEVSTVAWRSMTGFREWLSWLDLGNYDIARNALAYLDLSQQELEYLIFWDGNFEGTNLELVDLAKAQLTKANFSGANLHGASLPWADLNWAILTKANLNGADLDRAELLEANFVDAKLNNANLNQALLIRANFKGAEIVGAKFIGAELIEANLQGANLVNSNFERANLRSANLEMANLGGANLKEADLFGANLRGSDFTKANLDKSKFNAAVIGNTKFNNESFIQAEFKDFALREAFKYDVDISQLRSYTVGSPTKDQARELSELVAETKRQQK